MRTEPNLSRVQEAALLRLFYTGAVGAIKAPTLKALFDEDCVMEDADCRLVITDVGRLYCEKLLPRAATPIATAIEHGPWKGSR